MCIGIIVEGSDDKEVLKKIFAKKLGNKWSKIIKIISIGAGGSTLLNPRMVENTVRLLKEEKNCREIILLYDSDMPKKEQKEKLVTKKVGEVVRKYNITVAYAVVCIESWILGCFKEIRNPESFPDSKAAKRELREKMREKSNGRTISIIAEKNQIKHFERSDSFKEFESTI